jgi:hypothetical protein
MKILYCNSFETTHKREVFLLTFRFTAPDGKEEAFYVAISPSGAAVLHEILGKEIESYIREHGNIIVGDWKTDNCNCKEGNNNKPYVA